MKLYYILRSFLTFELVTMSESADVANGLSLESSKSSARIVTCCNFMRSCGGNEFIVRRYGAMESREI